MTIPIDDQENPAAATDNSGLQPADLLSMYRTMYLSRRIDDRELLMKRQQKIFFQISGAGHEAIGVAAGMALRSAYDWFFTYYRDRALALQLGVTPYEMFLEGVARRTTRPVAVGRCRPTGATRTTTWSASPARPGRSSCRPSAAPRPASARAERAWPTPASEFARRRGGARHDGRRHDLRGRVLGVAQHGLEPQAARDLPGRGQRVRHLGTGRGEHGRRQHLEARRRVSRTSW